MNKNEDTRPIVENTPAGISISYESLVFFLNEGRESEFKYENETYFISNEK